MPSQLRYVLAAVPGLLLACADTDLSTSSSEIFCSPEQVSNSSGIAETYSLLGSLPDLQENNAFFKNMGTTGRTCESCHGAAGGWTPSASQELWDDTRGTDPLFMFTHDVGVCPNVDVTRRSDRFREMQLLRERGLARGGVTPQPTWEFEVLAVDEPYGCATPATFFSYRKPNPSFAVSHKTSVTWAPALQPDMPTALKAFMVGATRNHGLTTYTPTEEEQTQGMNFMLFTYFAQIWDEDAGRLDAAGARGGPVHLANQEWFAGINHASTGATTRKVFDIYDAWLRSRDDDRRLIAEGQEIFNFRQNLTGGTCSGCHNSPNVGTRSVYQLFDIGIVDKIDEDLPRVRLRNKTTGEERTVSNLGRAAATGLWSDVGKMAVPILRGLSARAPYFSSGQARSLRDVVDHYDQRFSFQFTRRERTALAAFLAAL